MKKLICVLALWVIGSTHAVAGHDPVAEAVKLQAHACSLHAVIEDHTSDPYAIRAVHRLENSVNGLVEKMSCLHELGAIQWAMDDVRLHVERVVLVVKADCELRSDRHVVAALNCTLEQIAITDQSIHDLIARSSLGGRHHAPSPWYAGQNARVGSSFGAVDRGAPSYSSRYGRSGGLDHNAGVRDYGAGVRAGGGRGVEFPGGSPYGNSHRSTSPFASPGFGGSQPFAAPFATTPFPTVDPRASAGFGATRGPAQSAFPAPPIPGAGNGAVGRAILGVILSELSR